MKLWKLFVILFSILICGVSYAGFWSNDPGIGPGTRLPPGLIIPNPIISDPQLTGLITLVPGSTLWVQGNVIYEPYSIITGPDGSTWNVFGITNLANLTMSTSGVLTFADGSYWDNGGLDTSSNTVLNINGTSKVNFNNTTTLNFATGTTINGPDGSVWNVNGIQNLKSLSVVNNVSVGGNQTIGGSLTVNGPTILNGATTVINNFTADGTTTLNGPTNINNNLNVSGNTTLNNLTVTGNLTLPPGATATFPTLTVTQTFNAPDGSTWTTSGLNMQNGLSFHGVPMGGNCPATEYMAGLTSTGVISCSTPAGTGGGGSTLPTPTGPFQTLQTAANNSVVWNNTIGAGIAPNPAFPLVVGTGGTTLYQFSSTALNFSAGVGITFNGVPPGGACPANEFMVALSTSLIPTCAPGGVVTSSTPPASPIPGVLWFDPVSVQLFIWYKQNGQMQWVPVINQPNSAVGGIGTGGGITQLSAGQGITLSPSPINNGASGTVSLSTSPVTPGSYTNANITVNSLGIITAASSGTGGGGGSVSITAGNSAITVSPSPLTGTGTIALNMPANTCAAGSFFSAITATGTTTCTAGGGGGLPTATGPYQTLQSNASNAPVWNQNIGIGQAPGADLIDAVNNANAAATFLITNPNTGTAAQSYVSLKNGTHEGDMVMTGTGYTSAQPSQPTDGYTFITDGAGGLNFSSNTTAPIHFWVSQVLQAAFTTGGVTVGSPTGGGMGAGTVNAQGLYVNGVAVGTGGGGVTSITAGAGLTGGTITTTGTIALSTPVAVASGGTNNSTAPTAGQILIAPGTNSYTPHTVSGDCTLGAGGVIACTKTSGVAFTSAATTAIGTSGATIPLLSTANTWTLAQTFSVAPVMSGASITAATIPMAAHVNSGVTAGSYTNANITVNAQGFVTVAANGTGGGGVTSITAGTGLTGGTITTTGTIALAANPAGGALNFAPIASPTFTGTVTAPAFTTTNSGSTGIAFNPGASPPGAMMVSLGSTNLNFGVGAHFVAGNWIADDTNAAFLTQGLYSGAGGIGFYTATGLTPGNSFSPTLVALVSHGVQVGAPTGGDMGLGTINATGLYVNGVAVATGSFAPLTNPLGGQNNYAPSAFAIFTNQVNMPDSSVWTGGAGGGLIVKNDANYPYIFFNGTTALPKAAVQMQGGNGIFVMAGQHLNTSGAMIADTTTSGAAMLTSFNYQLDFPTGSTVGNPITHNYVMTVSSLAGQSLQLPKITSGTAGTGGGTGGGAACFTASQYVISNAANCIASSLSLKKDIRPLDGALATIEQLAPAAIYYRYKQGDPSEQPGFGAETVAQIDPRYVTFQNGKPAGIRYEQMAATEAVAITELKKQIDDLKAQIAAMRRAGQ